MRLDIHLQTFFDKDQTRISRDQLYGFIAEIMSLRATCYRGKVGAIIVKEHRIISTGYNGSLTNFDCETHCDIKNKCLHAVHAEQNAIAFAAKQGISLAGAILYCTTGPCYDCAKLIAQSGIIKVIYNTPYRNDDGVELLQGLGIVCEANEPTVDMITEMI